MKFQLVSDIHQEFLFHNKEPVWLPPEQEDDEDTVLLIAGDYYNWARERYALEGLIFKPLNERFKKVIYVPGNHEFYGSDIDTCVNIMKDRLKQYKNIVVADNDVIIIEEDVAVIASTLWGDLEGNNPASYISCMRGIADFSEIKKYKDDFVFGMFNPSDMYELYCKNKQFIHKSLVDTKGYKQVVVTHHAPSYDLVHAKYLRSKINGAFVGDCLDLIKDFQPNYWLFGHMHDTMCAKYGKTLCFNNPRGYYPYEINDKFNPTLKFEL